MVSIPKFSDFPKLTEIGCELANLLPGEKSECHEKYTADDSWAGAADRLAALGISFGASGAYAVYSANHSNALETAREHGATDRQAVTAALSGPSLSAENREALKTWAASLTDDEKRLIRNQLGITDAPVTEASEEDRLLHDLLQ